MTTRKTIIASASAISAVLVPAVINAISIPLDHNHQLPLEEEHGRVAAGFLVIAEAFASAAIGALAAWAFTRSKTPSAKVDSKEEPLLPKAASINGSDDGAAPAPASPKAATTFSATAAAPAVAAPAAAPAASA